MWKIHNVVINKYIIIFVSLFLLGCTIKDVDTKQEVSHKTNNSTNDTIFSINRIETIEEVFIGELESTLIEMNLVDIQSIDSTILVDVRYSTLNNFMKEDVYGDLEKIYLQRIVAIDLKKCSDYLKTIDTTLVLLVYDGVRPRSVQQKMWDILDLPINEKTKFVSNPKNGSIHNYGCAVDLTIANQYGDTLDMGAGYDDIRKIAYPRHEEKFLKSGDLTKEQIENRTLLRKVMKKGGFYNIETEWWHFNRYNRDKAKSLFSIVE
jgi:D-alanyl-D-alanine dipeptidase